jgi:hypothetical protein
MNDLKADLETKLTTPILGEKPIDQLVYAMRRCSDALIAVDELWDYIGTKARQLRVLSRMSLFEPEHFLQLVALTGDISAELNCINDSTDRNNGLRALERRLEAWLKAAPDQWDTNDPNEAQRILTLLAEDRNNIRTIVKLHLDGPDEDDDAFNKVLREATRAAEELRALVFAVAESL